PYGKTCTNCSRVKYKCIYRTNGDGCERCYRLKKQCHPSTSIRKRKNPPHTKTSELEDRVESLASIVRSQGQVLHLQDGKSSDQPHTGPVHLHTPNSNTGSGSHIIGTETLISTDEQIIVSDNRISLPITSYVSCYNIQDATAEAQLHIFRQFFIPVFPFVYIPAKTSASTLRLQKPFLWLVIMSLTTKSTAQQLAMGESIRTTMADSVARGSEKSLDVLLGIICYLGWFHYHKKDDFFLSMWTQIAISMTFSLGLHKSAPEPREENDEGQFSSALIGYPPQKHVSAFRTIEERRTVLAAWIMASTVWISIRKVQPPRWTIYLESCLQILGEEKESEHDDLLITQVKCHLIMGQITYPIVDPEISPQSRPPYFIKAILLQLKELKHNLPPQLSTNITAHLHIHSTEILAREASIHRPAQPLPATPNLSRLESLNALMASISQWLSVFDTIPTAARIGTSLQIAAQFSHCAVLGFRLCTLVEPGWDTEYAKQRINVLDVLDESARAFDELHALHGLVDDAKNGSGLVFKAPRLIRAMRANFA
ncbi:hypothetical protein CC78DRAFT_425554, partial [Lojkania enalia]